MESKKVLTTGEIGSSIGYTPQSVRNAVKELGLEPVSKQGRKLLYSVEQASAIAAHFGKDAVFDGREEAVDETEPAAERAEEPARDAEDSQIEFLKQQIAAKDAEIAEKNKQIDSLLDNLTTTNVQLSTAQAQLADAQSSIKALSATVTVHTASEHRDLIAANVPPQVQEEDKDESPRVDDLTRWQRLKSVFRRNKKKG